MGDQSHFDLIVIGAGLAGSAAASAVAGAGKSVAIVDELPYGGTCPNRGCDPKKILRRGAEIVHAARQMRGHGVDPGTLSVNWPDLVARKREYTDPYPERAEGWLASAGITTLHGHASFTDPGTVAVDGTAYTADRFVIATGARPRELEVPGGDLAIDSTGFMDLDQLPARILFLGGGFVSMEFAHMAARFGAQVTLASHGDRVLRGFDPDLVDQLVAATRREFDVLLSTSVREIRPDGDALVVLLDTPDGERELLVDCVVNGTGRVPNIDRLGLDAANVAHDHRGILVDRHLRSTSNPAVFAGGDVAVTGGAPITPVATMEGAILAANLQGGTETGDYTGIPRMVYSLPELGRVGMLESEARDAGIDVDVRDSDMGTWYSSFRTGTQTARVKVLVEKGTGRIVGAHVLGDGTDELLNDFGMAMRLGLTADQLRRPIAVYPSMGSDLEYLV